MVHIWSHRSNSIAGRLRLRQGPLFRCARPLVGACLDLLIFDRNTQTMNTRYTVLLSLAFVAGCNGSPGQLEGTWEADGLVPMIIIFRPGETEAMGVIEHVDYKSAGNAVEITYKDGLMKGTSMRFVFRDRDTAQNSMLTLRRVR
jgi:hypothetical protein